MIHNPQYFRFIASEPCAEINILVGSCSFGIGLQSAIIVACPWTNADVLDCSFPYSGTPAGASMQLYPCNLQPGETYWLVIDGQSGAICEYTITYVEGIELPGLEGELTFAQATPAAVCQGYGDLKLEAGPAVGLAHGYMWQLGWNNEIVVSSWPEHSIGMPANTPPGVYEVCVRAFSGCDTSDTAICFPVEVYEISDAVKPEIAVCPDAFPFFWGPVRITGPGDYLRTFTDPEGCVFDSLWTVQVHPDAIGLLDIAHCGDSYSFEGEVFYHSGTYQLIYPESDVNGCDSTLFLTLQLHSIDGFIEYACMDSQAVIIPHFYDQLSSGDTIYYEWYACGQDSLLSTADIFSPDSAGCYCLVVSCAACTDTICLVYPGDPCAADCRLVEDEGCVSDTIHFAYDGDIPQGAELHWLIDLPGRPEIYFYGDRSKSFEYTTPGCYGASLTIIDSFANVFTCRDSVCIFPPTTEASICCSETACDTCTTLVIELAGAAPWTIYILSDRGHTDTISGILSSPYYHTVCEIAGSLIFYSAIVTDSAGRCPAYFPDGNTVGITFAAFPISVISQSGDTLCAEPRNMAAYYWTGCGGLSDTLATTACFAPPESGCYCVEIVDLAGCSGFECYTFIKTATTQIHKDAIGIYPVPSQGMWQIHLSEDIMLPVRWQVTDLHGRTIDNGTLMQMQGSIVLRDIPPAGLYLIRLMTPDGQVGVKKVVVSKNP